MIGYMQTNNNHDKIKRHLATPSTKLTGTKGCGRITTTKKRLWAKTET